MQELGFFMDNLGNVLYYGEWKEHYDKDNRHQIHNTSFEDEVESTPVFQNLHLQYNSDMNLFGKAIAFALQGMITMQNHTSQRTTRFMMHAPEELTKAQEKKLVELYPLLSSFEEVTIVIPKSITIESDDTIDDLDSYFDRCGISSLKIRER